MFIDLLQRARISKRNSMRLVVRVRNCPSPFPPLAHADSSLFALLHRRQLLDKWTGHHGIRGYAVDQWVGVGVRIQQD